MNRAWRDTQWTMVAVSGGTWLLYVLTMPETRHNVSPCLALPSAELGTEIKK
jgi:hypothetical protein